MITFRMPWLSGALDNTASIRPTFAPLTTTSETSSGVAFVAPDSVRASQLAGSVLPSCPYRSEPPPSSTMRIDAIAGSSAIRRM